MESVCKYKKKDKVSSVMLCFFMGLDCLVDKQHAL